MSAGKSEFVVLNILRNVIAIQGWKESPHQC